MNLKKLTLNINGADRMFICDPEKDTLASVLRRLGLTGTKVGCGTGVCLSLIHIYWPRYLIALVLSVLWNFTLNRKFTFKSANNVPLAMMKILAFYCVFTPVTTILGNYLAENLGWNEYLVTGLNMLMNITTEYLYDRFVVFGKTIDTNDIAKKKAYKERK